MIYLESEKSNHLFFSEYHDFQSYYDACIQTWDLKRIACSSCHPSAFMRKNGFYKRRVLTGNGKEYVKIQRMRCPCCGHSDALFPVDIVPYSPVMMEEHVAIIEIYLETSHTGSFFHRISAITQECEENLSIEPCPDFQTVYKLIRRFINVWSVFSDQLTSLFCSLYSLVKFCISKKHICFQQYRGTARYIHTDALAVIT